MKIISVEDFLKTNILEFRYNVFSPVILNGTFRMTALWLGFGQESAMGNASICCNTAGTLLVVYLINCAQNCLHAGVCYYIRLELQLKYCQWTDNVFRQRTTSFKLLNIDRTCKCEVNFTVSAHRAMKMYGSVGKAPHILNLDIVGKF